MNERVTVESVGMRCCKTPKGEVTSSVHYIHQTLETWWDLLLQSINVWQVCILHRYLRGLNTIIFLPYTTVTDFLDRNRCEEGVTLALFCASLSRLGLWQEGPAGQSDAEPTTPGTWWPHYFAHGLRACV